MKWRRSSGYESAWRFFRGTLHQFGEHWVSYVKVAGVVALPANLLLAFDSVSSDNVITTYILFAAIIMVVALTWAITRTLASGSAPNVPTAYYEGSSAIVRYFLVNVVVVLTVVPASFGVLLYRTGFTAYGTANAFRPELLLIGLISLLFLATSVWLLARYLLASVIVVSENLRPVAALKRSRKVTLGKFWHVVQRLLMMVVWLFVVLLAPLVIAIGIGIIGHSSLAVVFFQLIIMMVVLPFVILYLLRLYRELQ